MKPLKAVTHIVTDVVLLTAMLGLPVVLTGTKPDAVSSASVIIEAPSGQFLVLLNTDTLEEDAFWEAYFSGEDVDFCFEDIHCMTAQSDAAALTMAQSFQSRLAEHQMDVRQEDLTLLMSKADHGKFQVIILSEELAAYCKAETAMCDGVKALHIGQEETA